MPIPPCERGDLLLSWETNNSRFLATARNDEITDLHQLGVASRSDSECDAVQYNGAMKPRRHATAFAITALGWIALSPCHAAAQEKAVRVLVSNGLKGAMEELQPLAEHAIGRPLAVKYNSTLMVKKSDRGR